MRKRVAPPVELETVEELLRRWRKRHGAPSRVARLRRLFGSYVEQPVF